MKKIKYKIIIPASMLLIILIVACGKNFLDKPPIGQLNPDLVTNLNGVQGLLIGAYSLVDGEGAAGDGFASGASNWLLGGVSSDDAYKGSDPTDVGDAAPLENWTITAANGFPDQKWKVCYAGIQRANDVLRNLPLATDVPTEPIDVGKQITGQALFLRAFYHFELKKIFGNIIYSDETVDRENTNVTNSVDVWPKIEVDLQAAIGDLPETWGTDKGRANSWAAKALLAKVYMYEGKYSDAYPILKDCIANGKTSAGDPYALFHNYYSNFNPAQKNGPESIFAAQTSVQDGSSVDWGGDPNGNYGDILNFPYNGGPGACCGFYNPSQDLANAYKTDATTGLPLLNGSWTAKPWVSEQYDATTYTGTLDPRIDWVIGRPGIPYLDWGNHPGLTWIRNPTNDGNKSPKKNVYALSQKSSYTDVGSAYWGPTELVANNVNIIRFADVILWAAECAIKVDGDLNAAKNYVNMIRERAAHPDSWIYINSDGNGTYDASGAKYAVTSKTAANYKIGLYTSFASPDEALKAVKFERRLELAMEGQRFFDLVRWGDAETVINAYIDRESSIRPLKQGGHFTAGKNEVFPIPQGEIDQMNSDGTTRLTQNPGY